MTAGTPPTPRVLAAFGVTERTELTPLAGAISQSAWRAGAVVLKPIQEPNPGEGDWVSDVLDAVIEDGFRVIKPIRADTGRWLVDGWSAWHWLEGEHERLAWDEVLVASRAFHVALANAVAALEYAPRPTWLDTRTHRWAVAEAVVWHDAPLPTNAVYDVPEFALWERARALGPPLSDGERRASQVIHGDIAGNVLRAADGQLAFIDVSPGWRPAASTEAQVLVEAVAWHGAPASTLDPVIASRDGRVAAARACGFRLLCGFQALSLGATFNDREIVRFARVLDAIGA